LVRIVQQNDWVIFVLTACIALYLFMLIYLHRDSTVRSFLFQQYADVTNNFLSWLIVSFIYVVLLTTLLSQTIPIVPQSVSRMQLFGYEFNKFGYTFLVLSGFYVLRAGLTYLFYKASNDAERWNHLQFVASKFFFSASLLLFGVCFMHYYYPQELKVVFSWYVWGLVIVFVFKNLVFLLATQPAFPEKTFYKILYICTLQIIPLLALWRLLYI